MAAQACFFGSSLGRFTRPSALMPRPTAPEETHSPAETHAGVVHAAQVSLHFRHLLGMLVPVPRGVGHAQPGTELLALDPAVIAGKQGQEQAQQSAHDEEPQQPGDQRPGTLPFRLYGPTPYFSRSA